MDSRIYNLRRKWQKSVTCLNVIESLPPSRRSSLISKQCTAYVVWLGDDREVAGSNSGLGCNLIFPRLLYQGAPCTCRISVWSFGFEKKLRSCVCVCHCVSACVMCVCLHVCVCVYMCVCLHVCMCDVCVQLNQRMYGVYVTWFFSVWCVCAASLSF